MYLAGLSCAETHTVILHAIEQIKGYKFTAKLQSKNALKNHKTTVPYKTDKNVLLVYK